VVLFDEVEKAHDQVFDLFLQIFDDGRLSGAHGRTADFSQAVVILTSNLTVTPPPKSRELGFRAPPGEEEAAPDPRAILAGRLRPELVGRLDDVVVFRPLGPEHLRRIIDRHIAAIEELLEPRGFRLEIEDPVYDRLMELGAGDRFGARELRRVVDRHLRQSLARLILERDDSRGGLLRARLEGDEIRID
jgi:ATP-dependent Clp protease ATP-binding subunit ClpA